MQYFHNDDSNNLSSFLLYVFTADFTSLYLSPKLCASTLSMNWERHVLDMSLVKMQHYQITKESLLNMILQEECIVYISQDHYKSWFIFMVGLR